MRERQQLRRLVAFAVALATVASVSVDGAARAAPRPLVNPFRTGRTLIIPHSGGDGLSPENTLYAYEKSMAMGGDVIDIDVSLTADGVPVAFHDSSLRRTTGAPGKVSTTAFAELSKLDAGWGFTSHGTHPFRGKGLTVPSVEAILRRFPATLVTFDLKDQRTLAVKPVCELLARLRRIDDVYVGVDSSAQVLEFRRTCPGLRTSGTDAERRAARRPENRETVPFAPRNW